MVLQLSVQNETIFSTWYFAKRTSQVPTARPLLMANVQVMTLTEQIEDLQNKSVCNDYSHQILSQKQLFLSGCSVI
jgi:hypothetical protein